MTADRQHHKCHPRTVEDFQNKLAELKKWMGNPAPPAHFHKEWFAGLCAEPGQFTEQLLKLREALKPSGEPEPVPVRQR
jgi:hypothetical protein